MNKKIKELALQAGGSHYPTVGGKTLETFAELVVRECARVYWSIDDGELHDEYVKALKKHFGVEK
jgi:hypothetical protein